MKTHVTRKTDIERKWHLLDANGQILGRFASQIAQLLQGKNKTYYTPALDCGDWIVVTNAEKIRVTGRKEKQKMYRHHTGWPEGFRELSYKQLMAKDPRRIITHAVWGMLPKNKLRAKRMIRLKVFVGSEHPYTNKFKNN
jgi:large subunit ribosomal protein L13